MSDPIVSDLTAEAAPDAPPALAVVMTTLLEVQEEQRALSEALARHIADDERRLRLVDQFIDPQLALDSLLKQILEQLRRQKEALEHMERSLHEEHHTTRTAVALHMADPSAPERAHRRTG